MSHESSQDRALQEGLVDYCLAKQGAEPTFPFGPEILVVKVLGKMFALTARRESCPSFNLKCAPERALALRATFPAVQPGYHMNKRHWNTVTLDGSLSAEEIQRMIDHSYDLVVAALSRADRERLGQADPSRARSRDVEVARVSRGDPGS